MKKNLRSVGIIQFSAINCWKKCQTLIFSRLYIVVIVAISLFSINKSYSQISSGTAPVDPPSGGFGIEGDLRANTPTPNIGDWIPNAGGTGGSVLDANGNPLVPANTFHNLDNWGAVQNDDNIFGSAVKFFGDPTTWDWTLGSATNKLNLNNILFDITTDSAGNAWAVVSADRYTTDGDSYMDFEFLQDSLYTLPLGGNGKGGFATTASSATDHRSVGDFIVTVAFTSGGTSFSFWRWELSGGKYTYVQKTVAPGSAYAATNANTLNVPYPAFGQNTYIPRSFVEAAINLTTVLGSINPCTDLLIKTILVKSKSSTSDQANCNDFVAPFYVSNLSLGSAEAGPPQFECEQADSTVFVLHGYALPAPGYSVVTTTWTTLSYSGAKAPYIVSPDSLSSLVYLYDSIATIQLEVVTQQNPPGTNTCYAYDEVTLTVYPPPDVSITISGDESHCPLTTNTYFGPPGYSYDWTITGNGSITSATNTQTVSVISGAECDSTYTLRLITTESTNSCTDTAWKIVNIFDTIDPTASNPPDITVSQCNANYPDPDPAVVTDEADNCGTPTVTWYADSAAYLSGCTEHIKGPTKLPILVATLY